MVTSMGINHRSRSEGSTSYHIRGCRGGVKNARGFHDETELTGGIRDWTPLAIQRKGVAVSPSPPLLSVKAERLGATPSSRGKGRRKGAIVFDEGG